jgi:hypothetical protein
MNFRKIYPPNGQNLLDGGMNNKFERSLIEDNESPDCLNVVFENGSVGTRNGFKKINTASVGTFVCDGLYTRKGTNNAETMVAFYGGNGYTLDNTSLVTIPSAQSVFTMANRVGAAQMENHLFVGNGGVIPYKYNGTDFTRHGVYPPSMTASFYTGAAGNPIGDYRYKVVFVNSASVQGNPSDASATFTVTSAQISLTCLPIAPQSWGVSSRQLYRTVTSGATFLRVTTINDNTTTTYLDNTADASLGTAAPSEKGVPPKYSTIIYHQNRLWMNDTENPGFVWYTDLNEPYTVASTNFIVVGDQASDLVKGFAVQDNSLVIFCERNIWINYMPSTTVTDWRIIKAKSAFTSKSPHGNFTYNNKVGFPAMQNDKFVGVASLIGDEVEPSASALTNSTMGSELKSDRIETDMFDIQESVIGNISSIVYKNKAYISMTKASGNSTNNRVYVMDFSIDNVSKNQKEAWSPWSGLNAAQFTIYNGSLYYGSSNAVGFLFKEDPGVYADNGGAINSYFWTKEFTGLRNEKSFQKDFRFLNILADLPGAYYMNVGIKTDSDAGSGTDYAVSVDPESELWGSMVWGVDPWGGGSYQKDIKVALAGAAGKRVQFKFSNQNTINQKFKVHWMNFTYNLKGPR